MRRPWSRREILAGAVAGALLTIPAARAQHAPAAPPAEKPPGEAQPSPEELMRSRYPHPVKVGDLIGLPVLDWRDSTLGYVQEVVRTPDGKIKLVVPYRQWLGWLQAVSFGRRTVPVPLELVALLGPHVAALDMSREQFDAAPDWNPSQGQPIPSADTIMIALTKR